MPPAGERVSPGPDWMDVSIMVKELEREYGLTVMIGIGVGGGRYAGTIEVWVRAAEPNLSRGLSGLVTVDTDYFPNSRHRTLEAMVYRMVLEMLHRLSLTHLRQQTLEGL